MEPGGLVDDHTGGKSELPLRELYLLVKRHTTGSGHVATLLKVNDSSGSIPV
jgi:hypothetical protein